MSTSPLDDVVSNQYEQWIYPEPIEELPSWLSDNWQWFDPSHAHRLFWPDRDHRADLDILVAGCGSNQGAVLAYTNPKARIVAVDVSQASLDHHQHLKEKYRLSNLELIQLPIERIKSLNREFDLIISTGVLHHLEVPEEGLKALASCLRRDGVIALMLYAKYGRIGVELLQGVFRELGLGQNNPSVLMVKETLATLSDEHPVKTYIGMAPDLEFDAGLVDTFLHGRDRSYSIDDCVELVHGAGLVFQDLFLKTPYYAPVFSTRSFHAAVAALPEQKQWSLMERINNTNSCHFFTACRADRPTKSFKIDFGSVEANTYIPSLRYRCELRDNQLFRQTWSVNLDPVELAMLQQVDGCRTIQDVVATAIQSGVFPRGSTAEHEQLGRKVMRSLWQRDLVAMQLNQAKPPRRRKG